MTEKAKEMLGDIVKSCYEKAQGQQKAKGYIKLEVVFATIPLPGIGAPFHSRYLWAGVLPFCMCTFFLLDLFFNSLLIHINFGLIKEDQH